MDQDPEIDQTGPAELAALELDRGHYDSGAAALDQAVLAEPFSAAVTNVLEQVFQRLSGTGQEQLRDAMLRYPNTGLRLALVAVDKGDMDRALDWCTVLVEQEYPEALILQSLILQIRDDYQGALRAADQYVALRAGSPSGYLRRAAVHGVIGDKAELKADAESSRTAYERALADYDHALRLAPGLVEALLDRARLLERMGQADLALDAYASALARVPKLADAHAGRGRLHQASGYYQNALADYDAWVDSAPGNAHAYWNRATVHIALGHIGPGIVDYDQALALMPDLQQARLERAQLLAAEGRPDLALHDYDEVLRRDPDYVLARGLRGDLLVILGDTAGPGTQAGPSEYYWRALDDYSAVIGLAPDIAEPYFRRGEVQVRLNEHLQALQDFETAISLDPTHMEAYLRRGDALTVLADNFRALSSYSQAARLDRRNPNAHLGKALAHLGLGDGYRDRRSFDKMHEEFEAAISACEEALRLIRQSAADGDPANLVTLACSYQGRALRGLADYDAAIKTFEEASAAAAALGSEFQAGLIAERGETIRLWGVLAEHPGKLREAAGVLEGAVAAHPDRADLAWIQYSKGLALTDLAQYDEALSAFDAALEANSVYGWGYIGRGKAHYYRGDLADAMSSFRMVLELEANRDLYRPWAEVGVSLVLRRQGRDTEAEQALKLAIDGSRSARCYLDRAAILEDFGAWQLAERDRQQATTIKPGSAEAHGALAWSHIQHQPTSERLKAAIEIAQKAVDVSRDRVMRAACLDSVAWAHYKLGDHQRAILLLEQAVQMDRRHVLIRMHLEDARAAVQPRAS